MTEYTSSNPFAPPRAHVDDHVEVGEEMIEASRGSRFAAILIDIAPTFLLGVGAAIALPAYDSYRKHAGGGVPASTASSIGVILGGFMALALVGYAIYSMLLVYRHGQSFGKKVMGIRVVRTDGSRVSFGRFLLLRWIPLGIAGNIPIVGFLISLADSLCIFRTPARCLHDQIADTMVVTAASSTSATLAGSRGETSLRTFTTE